MPTRSPHGRSGLTGRSPIENAAPPGDGRDTLILGRRLPDDTRLAWARTVIGRDEGQASSPDDPEVYANEAIYLHDEPRRELKLQAIRIGELGITAIPNEVYAITGLKIKAQSPLAISR